MSSGKCVVELRCYAHQAIEYRVAGAEPSRQCAAAARRIDDEVRVQLVDGHCGLDDAVVLAVEEPDILPREIRRRVDLAPFRPRVCLLEHTRHLLLVDRLLGI